MLLGERVNQVGLDFVGVLIFIHEHVLELLAVALANFGVRLKQDERLHQEIIVIHRVRRALAFGVPALDFLDLLFQM